MTLHGVARAMQGLDNNVKHAKDLRHDIKTPELATLQVVNFQVEQDPRPKLAGRNHPHIGRREPRGPKLDSSSPSSCSLLRD